MAMTASFSARINIKTALAIEEFMEKHNLQTNREFLEYIVENYLSDKNKVEEIQSKEDEEEVWEIG